MKTIITLLTLSASVLAGPSKQSKPAAPSVAAARVRPTWGIYKQLSVDTARSGVAVLTWTPTLADKFIPGSLVLFKAYYVSSSEEPDGELVTVARARCGENWNPEGRVVASAPLKGKVATAAMQLSFAGCSAGQQAHVEFWREPRDSRDSAKNIVTLVLVMIEQ